MDYYCRGSAVGIGRVLWLLGSKVEGVLANNCDKQKSD
jgi:hypothetical protein